MQGLNLIQGKNISIHALREEGDLVTFADTSIRLYFYPRPPRGGRRQNGRREHSDAYFYPRPPRGGRPGFSPRPQQSCYDFYPRPPRGGRPGKRIGPPRASPISIHALREEGDLPSMPLQSTSRKFLSTPSARRATDRLGGCPPPALISIHALREEGDQDIPLVPLIDDNFYPRPPRGGRPRWRCWGF